MTVRVPDAPLPMRVQNYSFWPYSPTQHADRPSAYSWGRWAVATNKQIWLSSCTLVTQTLTTCNCCCCICFVRPLFVQRDKVEARITELLTAIPTALPAPSLVYGRTRGGHPRFIPLNASRADDLTTPVHRALNLHRNRQVHAAHFQHQVIPQYWATECKECAGVHPIGTCAPAVSATRSSQEDSQNSAWFVSVLSMGPPSTRVPMMFRPCSFLHT